MRSVRVLASVVGAAAVAVSLAGLPVVAASAEGATATIFVPRSVIYPGDEISADFLVERKIVGGAQAAAPFGSNKDDVVGKVARRTLVPGQPIPASAVREKAVVIQGRSYDILYKSGALTVKGAAVPLQSAAVGETVNVRNPETGIVVKAVVQAGGTLLVNAQ